MPIYWTMVGKSQGARKHAPTGALKALHVEDLEMEKIKEEQNLEEFNPQFKTKPRVHYKISTFTINALLEGQWCL